MEKESIYTIAKQAGVSPTTVSRVLNGKARSYRISADTEKKVKAAVSKSSYLPRSIKKQINNAKSNLIGLVLPSLANPFFAEMASVLVSEINKKNYTTIIVDAQENDYLFTEGLKSMSAKKVEGIIAIPCGENQGVIETISSKIPVVLLDRYFDDTRLSYVTTNNYLGGCMATKTLIAAGHTKIAVIQGQPQSMPNKQRVKGYEETMVSNGLNDKIDISGEEFSARNGYEAAMTLLKRNECPTAIFALSNTILLGVIKAVKELGLIIPDDISVISFDDNIFMYYMTQQINRIGQPVEDMSKLAVKLLFDKIEQKEIAVSQVLLSPTMIEGDSVAKIHSTTSQSIQNQRPFEY